MIIKSVEYQEPKIVNKIEKFCCKIMDNLYNNFNILHTGRTGHLYLETESDSGYRLCEKLECCPFCGEKINTERKP